MTIIIETGPDTAISTSSGANYASSVAGLSGGGYVVTWVQSSGMSFDPHAGLVYDYDIYGRIVDANGVAGSIIRIDANDAPGQHGSAVSVAAVAGGGFAVAWNEERLGYNGSTADEDYTTQWEFRRAYGGDGSPVNLSGSSHVIGPSDASRDWYGPPTVVSASDGGFDYIAEVSDGAALTVGHYGAQGAPSVLQTTTQTPDLYSAPGEAASSIAALSNGSRVVVWAANGAGGDGDGAGVFMRLFNSSFGAIASGQVNVSNIGDQADASVVAVDGGFIACWQSGSQIFSQRYDLQGQRVGTETLLVGSGFDLEVASLSDGGFVAVWASGEVYAQRFSATGVATTGVIAVTQTTEEDELTIKSDPSVSALSNGGFTVSWSESFIGSSAVHSRIFGPVQTNGTMSAATEVVQGTGDADVVKVAPGGLNAGDNVDLGGGTDKLVMTAAGTIDLTAPDVFQNVEVLVGTAGDDTFIVSTDRLAGVTTVSLGAGVNTFAAVGDFTLHAGLNVANIRAAAPGSAQGYSYTGNEFSQAITGNAGANAIRGEGGNDTLTGGGGRDTLYGGEGNDTFYVENNTDSAREAVGEGIDTVLAASTFFLFPSSEIEFLKTQNAAGTAAIDLKGNGFDQAITGNAGVNDIDGGGGADTMAGLGGNDTYHVDDAGDRVSDGANAGYDTVHATISSYTLSANVERLYFDDTGNHVGKGNDLSNILYGNAGLDRFLIDAGGADTFSGGAGEDTFDGRAATTGMTLRLDAQANNAGSVAGDTFASVEKFFGSDTAADAMTTGAARAKFFGYGGNDTLTGGSSVDALSGGAGNDSLVGNGGQDALDGGIGNDTMTGGADRDLFTFVDAAFGKDLITDFQDGIDRLKIYSAVANDIGDFIIRGNGTTQVTLQLADAPANVITLHGADAITITAADFLFY